MSDKNWQVITEVAGELEAELLKSMLEAQGVEVLITREASARAIGLNLGPMGKVQLLVPGEEAAFSKKLIDDYYGGKLSAKSQD